MTDNSSERTSDAETIASDIAVVMVRHGIDLNALSAFLAENAKLFHAVMAKKKQHRAYLDDRARIRRELLRRHINGETYRQIAETLDINLARASETKALELNRIWKAVKADPNSVQTLAEEYRLTTHDIMAIFQKRQDREDWRREQDRLWQEERDADYAELIGVSDDD